MTYFEFFRSLLRNVEFHTGSHLIRVRQLVTIRFEDLHILIGVAVEVLADLREAVARLHRVRPLWRYRGPTGYLGSPCRRLNVRNCSRSSVT
jgi:hypothetical protein